MAHFKRRNGILIIDRDGAGFEIALVKVYTPNATGLDAGPTVFCRPTDHRSRRSFAVTTSQVSILRLVRNLQTSPDEFSVAFFTSFDDRFAEAAIRHDLIVVAVVILAPALTVVAYEMLRASGAREIDLCCVRLQE